jgi:hypothetical protein
VSRVEIRPPPALRVYILVLGIVWAGIFVGAAVAFGATPLVLIPGAMLVAGLVTLVRLAGVAVIADDDELVARNLWTTTRVRRGAISGFRRERGSPLSPNLSAEAVTADGRTVPLDALGLPALPVLHRRRRIEAGLRDLGAWLETGETRRVS